MTMTGADSHLSETRDLWATRTAARHRDLALRIADDAQGYAWLLLGDRRIEVLGIHNPVTSPSPARPANGSRPGSRARMS